MGWEFEGKKCTCTLDWFDPISKHGWGRFCFSPFLGCHVDCMLVSSQFAFVKVILCNTSRCRLYVRSRDFRHVLALHAFPRHRACHVCWCDCNSCAPACWRLRLNDSVSSDVLIVLPSPKCVCVFGGRRQRGDFRLASTHQTFTNQPYLANTVSYEERLTQL